MIIMTTLSFQAMPHYLAPATGLIVFLAVQGLRRLAMFKTGKRQLGRGVIALLVITTCYLQTNKIAQRYEFGKENNDLWHLQRQEMIQKLEKTNKQHLIIVRYSPEHNVHHEWVYNEADIDKAKVVWAREMDPKSNKQLIQYFRDRNIWLLEADAEQGILEPYPFSKA